MEGCNQISRVNNILDTLAGSQYSRSLNLLSSHWQLEVDQEDQDKTICPPDGLFEFQVTIVHATATFQWLSEQWTSYLVYLNDVIVVGRNLKSTSYILGVYFREYENSKMVKNFATIAKCLHQLIEKNREYKGTNQCQHVFEELQCRLLLVPELSFPDLQSHLC